MFTRSIALAFALSVLLHSAALWLLQVQPQVQLLHNEALPPPLMAKLEPLPKRAANPAPPARRKTKTRSPSRA